MSTTRWIFTGIAAVTMAIGLSIGTAEAQRMNQPPGDRPIISYDGGRTGVTPPPHPGFGPVIKRFPRDKDTYMVDADKARARKDQKRGLNQN